MIPTEVKNIIFDLGGVLLDIDVERTIEAFRRLKLPDVIKKGGWDYKHDTFLNMEKGLLSEAEFRDGVRELLPFYVADNKINDAWCAMIIRFDEEKIKIVQGLSKRFKIYLFSNTNSIHVRYFTNMFLSQFGFPLSELFVKDYYSNDIELRKPEPRAFQHVLDDAGLIPEETLFIDDLKANTDAARSLGIHVIYLKRNMIFKNIFEQESLKIMVK